MNIGWPEGIYLGLTAFGLGVGVAQVNAGRSTVGRLLVSCIVSAGAIGLLYWGGFFA